MSNCCYGMMPQHTRSGISHDFTHLLTHHGLVAMHRTSLASWFMVAESAMVETDVGIIQQSLAIVAYRCALVMSMTIQVDHLPNGLFLSFDTCHRLMATNIT